MQTPEFKPVTVRHLSSEADLHFPLFGPELPHEADLCPGSPVVDLPSVASVPLARDGELRAETPYREVPPEHGKTN